MNSRLPEREPGKERGGDEPRPSCYPSRGTGGEAPSAPVSAWQSPLSSSEPCAFVALAGFLHLWPPVLSREAG